MEKFKNRALSYICGKDLKEDMFNFYVYLINVYLPNNYTDRITNNPYFRTQVHIALYEYLKDIEFEDDSFENLINRFDIDNFLNNFIKSSNVIEAPRDKEQEFAELRESFVEEIDRQGAKIIENDSPEEVGEDSFKINEFIDMGCENFDKEIDMRNDSLNKLLKEIDMSLEDFPEDFDEDILSVTGIE